jgi:tryptophan synthase beta chain
MTSTLHVRPPVHGAFGAYGGRFVSELLRPALDELDRAVREILPSPSYRAELAGELAAWAGRPTPTTRADRLSEVCDLEILLKREDLLHGGAHKTNNVVGQGLLARRMGKTRLIAETGAGQHGVATAMIGARLGLPTEVFMGARDMERQASNVETMRLCGATVVPVRGGEATLKEAVNEALRAWTATSDTTAYVLGTVCGPDPYPRLVADLQSVIGEEARSQVVAELGRLPDALVACVGGGSNAIGLWSAFLDTDVTMFGVEPGGPDADETRHGRTLGAGSPGLLHGSRSYVLQDEEGQIAEAASVAAGLDYPGVGPQHAALRDSGRVTYVSATDAEALAAFRELSRLEGIVPAFESSHALAFLRTAVERGHLPRGATVLVNLSGRGQKDLETWSRLTAGGEVRP